MPKFIQLALIIFAVTSVAIGDVFIKKAAHTGSLSAAFTNKWMLLGVLCYLIQIALFTWMFVKGWDLSIIGSLQTVFYAAVVLSFGIFWFGESLTVMQYVGVALAFIGVMMINWFAAA